jgi:hypothetical protein
MIEEIEERKAEKAKALKEMRKYGFRFMVSATIFYLIAHFYFKLF